MAAPAGVVKKSAQNPSDYFKKDKSKEILL